MAFLTIEPTKLVIKLDYKTERQVIPMMKAGIPPHQRSYDPVSHLWTFNTGCLSDLRSLFASAGLTLDEIGAMPTTPVNRTQTGTLDIVYLAPMKARTTGEPTAFGCWKGTWDVVFPEAVLKAFFGIASAANIPDPDPVGPPALDKTSHYTVLGLTPPAFGQISDAEVVKAYRSKAKQYHPDYNKNPDAHQEWLVLAAAKDTLTDAMKRRKYDIALRIASANGAVKPPMKKRSTANANAGASLWRAPWTCGKVTCEYRGERRGCRDSEDHRLGAD